MLKLTPSPGQPDGDFLKGEGGGSVLEVFKSQQKSKEGQKRSENAMWLNRGHLPHTLHLHPPLLTR